MRNITPMVDADQREEALELLRADLGEGQADGFVEAHRARTTLCLRPDVSDI